MLTVFVCVCLNWFDERSERDTLVGVSDNSAKCIKNEQGKIIVC